MGVERNRTIGVGERLHVFAAEIMRPGAIVVGERRVRRKLDRAGIVGHGVGEFEAFAFGVAAIDVGVGKPRIELDGLIEIGNGSLRLTLCDPGAASVVECGGRGIELDRLIIVGDRAVDIAFAPPRDASVVHRRGISSDRSSALHCSRRSRGQALPCRRRHCRDC